MVEDRVTDWALAEAMAFGSLLKEGSFSDFFLVYFLILCRS